MTQLRMLACFAHPDDEAFTASGVLAAGTARGVETRLVCATYGEMGDIRQEGLATPETLGEVRHQELRQSCRVLGLQEPVMLGYRDSGWGDDPAQDHPRAFVKAPAQVVVQSLVEEIRRFRPHLVLTFEPEGISGHKDHKAICRHTTAAVQVAGDPGAFPGHFRDGLRPHAPLRLFYVARVQGHRLQRALQLRQAGLDVPLPPPEQSHSGVPLEDIHVIQDVEGYLDQKIASILCHRTQIGPEWGLDRVPREVARAILGREYLLQGYPQVAPGWKPMTDFLEGVIAAVQG